ncbi:hypothetical protein PCANC_13102 [Puccinia coronata f. sp. avenae]|uniref:Uncharacterized protein n=1 Tax=Puccinia coronata f. sp. avenae TaxID=200324 RepID=A0A2N5UV27_9BASI|nr:hypothetical protein PCANC_13102 [Puccinia coronata f. sp. avenae]
MINIQRRSANDSELSQLPEGTNPFRYITHEIGSNFFPEFSRFTTALLIIFFIFHLLIAIFCLAILILPYFRRTKRSRWFYRKLHFRDQSGNNVYRAPLFWVNAGLLMTISQLVVSVASQSFIVINLRWKMSVDYAIHNPMVPSLGLMIVGEMFTYWALMHCFVVAIYYDQRPHENASNGVARWTVSPTLINLIFVAFPLGVVVTIVLICAFLTLDDHKFDLEVIKGLTILGNGASTWDKLSVSTTTADEKTQLMLLLLEVVSEAKVINQNGNIRLDIFIKLFHIVFCVVLALHCITFLVFLGVFGMVVRKFHQKRSHSTLAMSNFNIFRRWFKSKDSQTTSKNQLLSKNEKMISASNRQFLHLLVRTLCIISAMITSTIVFSIGVIKTDDILRTPKWRGIMVWLVTVAGSWSSIPIAWQCWRIYQDESSGSSTASENSKGSSSEDKSDAPHKPWQSDSDVQEIEIRLDSTTQIQQIPCAEP